MLFHSFEFIFLLVVTFILYYLFPKGRLWLLAIANLVFYSVSGWGYLLIFLGVSAVTYYCSTRLEGPHGKLYYYFGLLVNLLNLAFFKYTGFILKNLETALGLHFPWQDSLLAKIVLPIGISFYTFQLIAYLVDVKRKEIAPCESFVKFWVFISFFAQLIAGPIMRGKEFLPQISSLKKINYQTEYIRDGLYYIAMGMGKKLIFADLLASKVDYYFLQASHLGTLESWFASYLFAFQIYFDFSSYSEIAVGVGKLFGFDMAINFKTPYLSGNPSEFWKRWHITLSSWIKDYLYIPMGGSKKGFTLQCVFLLIAMTLSGLWHGAAWSFIVWGLYHGLLSVLHKIYRRWQQTHHPAWIQSKWYRALSIFVFFQLTTIGWVFFRAATLQEALHMIQGMLSLNQIRISPIHLFYFGFIALLWLLHYIEYLVRKNAPVLIGHWQTRVPEFVRAAAYVMVLLILILFTQGEQSTFIYFQF